MDFSKKRGLMGWWTFAALTGSALASVACGGDVTPDDGSKEQHVGQCQAEPSCAGGFDTYATEAECRQGGSICEVATQCGKSIWCGKRAETCRAEPVCPAGTKTHETSSECPQDIDCSPVTECGKTVWCSSDVETCTGIPVCPGNSESFPSSSACPQDVGCTPVSLCGTTVWCSEASPPRCDDGDLERTKEECANLTCYERTANGRTIFCAKAR